MNRLSRQKINKEILTLKGKVEWTDLIDIYRTFHPKAAEYTWNIPQDRAHARPQNKPQ